MIICFQLVRKLINNSNNQIELFPYRLIKRINKPKTINFFILHEGFISILNDELLEKKYDDISDDCSASLNNMNNYCNQKSKGGLARNYR